MVITDTQISNTRNTTLDVFDAFTEGASGTSSTIPLESDTTLGTELTRNIIPNTIKDLSAGEYIFRVRIPVDEANGSAISEVGIFDAVTGGNLGIKLLTPSVFTNTSNDEILIDIFVGITIT